MVVRGKYSQNDEDIIIDRYFRGRIGTLLSIGENDGKTLSNVLDRIEHGWSAVLVEPSAAAFEKMKALHDGNNKVHCFNVAIGKADGAATFYESGDHLGLGDTSLISTLEQSETDRWKGSKYDNFVMTTVEVNTWQSFCLKSPFSRYDLVSIDAEGLDLYILSQMEITCDMLIVEFNGKDETHYATLAANGGLRLISKNMENLIFAR